MDWLMRTADRLESVYLAALRIGVLVLATLALIVAVFIAGDGLRSLMTSTKVEPDAIVVTPGELSRAVEVKRQASDDAAAAAPTISDAVKKQHQAFLNGPFAPYYNVYAASARTYNKPEDKVLTREELADLLGYGLERFANDPDYTAGLFYRDANYGAQILEAVRTASAQQSFVRQLQKYKGAEKTAKACRTVYERRRGWDSYSTGCDGWWQSPIGCPVIRAVPVQSCEPAYPADITSPAEAFANLDRGFRELWKQKVEASSDKAAAAEARREALKATGVPKLTKAMTLLGLFLGVMFLFLIIAVERHLRKLKAVSIEGAG